MSTRRKAFTLPSSLPVAARKLFGRFPHVGWVSKSVYRKRLVDMLATLQPSNTVEALWAKDIVDATFEIEILRQVEAALLEAQARAADVTQETTNRHMAEARANFAVSAWAKRQGLDHRSNTPEIQAQWAKFVDEGLSKHPQRATSQDTAADPNELVQSFLRHGADLDRISRMIAVAESRRRSALQELERYRAARHGRLRRTGVIVARSEAHINP